MIAWHERCSTLTGRSVGLDEEDNHDEPGATPGLEFADKPTNGEYVTPGIGTHRRPIEAGDNSLQLLAADALKSLTITTYTVV